MEQNATELLRWIILFPVAGAFLNGCVIRSKNAIISGLIATLAALGAFAVSVIAIQQWGSATAIDAVSDWMVAGKLHVPFHLEYTTLTACMLMVISGIGSLIHIYSISYMAHDESPWRFFTYLNMFLAAMLILVLSAGLVGIFVGWEGVGLCSYLLIGYWYKKNENASAGMKAFVVNRIGDLGFLLALFCVGTYVGSFEIRDILTHLADPQIPAWVWTAVAGGIFWASTGKSAQIPLYIWLPDAMAGPTPVSALIHAATMVTSGIFVSVRLWPLFATQVDVLHVMACVGVATAWLAALIAFTQRDIKKVLAYSTVSQLGFMFAALGLGQPVAAFFHVVTHACFKALLFLGSGSVIHGMHEKQDLYEMGNLKHHMPITHFTFLVGTLAIIGFPFTAGFFSKDLILGKAFESNSIIFVLLLSAALMTAFYMLRAYTLCFWGKARSHEAEHAHESSWVMTVPLCVLAFLSVFVGWIETPTVIGGFHTLQHWIEGSWYQWHPTEGHPVEELGHGAEILLMLATAALSLGVAWFSYKRFQKSPDGSEPVGLAKISYRKFYIDEFYDCVVVKPLSRLAQYSTQLIDQILINGGLHRVRDLARGLGSGFSILHTGNFQTYAVYFILGLLIILSLAKRVFL